MYQFMLVWLIATAIFQFFKPNTKINCLLFWVSVGILTYMQVFRYGQGSDYWGYRAIYASAPYRRGFPMYWYTCDIHGEIGFKFLINIFTNFGIPPFWFYGLFGTATIAFVVVSIKKNSVSENLSLLLFYPTFYLSYVLSGIRQAMVAAVFLVFALELLWKEKYLRYIVVIFLCASIHIMALFFLILLPVKWLKEKWIVFCVPIVWLGGAIFALTPLHNLVSELTGLARLNTVQLSIGGLAERTLMFGIISILYWFGKKEEKISFFYKIYGIGYLVAIAGMITAYGSQRITMPFKLVEILLVPMLLVDCSKMIYKRAGWGIVIGASLIMSLKNLQFYSEKYDAFTYPYISIWDGRDESRENTMLEIRSDWDERYDEKTR